MNFQGIRLHEFAHLCKLSKTKVGRSLRVNFLFNLDFCFGVVAGSSKNAAPLGAFAIFGVRAEFNRFGEMGEGDYRGWGLF
jgi:hypothetical protein